MKKKKKVKTEKQILCPHCGYYCTGKTVFCTPPYIEKKDGTLVKIGGKYGSKK